MFVFDDYAENIQQNQGKTAILAAISRFFSRQSRILAVFSASEGHFRTWPASDSCSLAARLKRHQKPAGRRDHRDAEPRSGIRLGASTAWLKSLNERCMWKVPSLTRSRIVGLSEWDALRHLRQLLSRRNELPLP